MDRSLDNGSFWYKKEGVAVAQETLLVFEDQIEGKECISEAKINVDCQEFGKEPSFYLISVTNQFTYRVWKMEPHKYYSQNL